MHVRRARSNKQKSNQIHFNFCSRRWLTLHQRKQDALSLRFHHVIVGSGNFAGWRASECVLPITATCAFPGRPAQITRASQQRMLGCITFLLTRFFLLPPTCSLEACCIPVADRVTLLSVLCPPLLTARRPYSCSLNGIRHKSVVEYAPCSPYVVFSTRQGDLVFCDCGSQNFCDCGSQKNK